MPDVYGPFDTASFQQAAWYRDRGYLELSGVYGAAQVNPTPAVGDLPLSMAGLTGSLGLGRAHVRGAYYERTGAAFTYTHPANTDPTNYRVDRYVLRRDLGAKTVVPAVLQGAPAAFPTAVALTQNDAGVWEIGLYQVTVPPASGTGTAITDERYWLGTNGNGIARGQNVPGVTVGDARDHPTFGLQRWNGVVWGAPVLLPRCTAYRTTAQGIATGTTTVLSFTTQTTRSTSGMWAIGAPTRLIAPENGEYDVSAHLSWVGSVNAGAVSAQIRVNGSVSYFLDGRPSNTSYGAEQAPTLRGLELNASDYVEIMALQNTDATRNISSSRATLALATR